MNKTNLIFTISLSIIGLAVLGIIIGIVFEKKTIHTAQDNPSRNRVITCRDIDGGNPAPLTIPSNARSLETKQQRDSEITPYIYPDECVSNNPSLIEETFCEDSVINTKGEKISITPRVSSVITDCPTRHECKTNLLVDYPEEVEKEIVRQIIEDAESFQERKLRELIQARNPGFTEEQVEAQVQQEFNSYESQSDINDMIESKHNQYFLAAACVPKPTRVTAPSRDNKNSPTYTDATQLPEDTDKNRLRYDDRLVGGNKQIYPRPVQ